MRARFYRGNGCAYTLSLTHTHNVSLSLPLSIKHSLPPTLSLSFSLSPKHTLNLSFTLFHTSFSLKHTHTLSLYNTPIRSHPQCLQHVSPSPSKLFLILSALKSGGRTPLYFLLSFRLCIVSHQLPLFPTFFPSVYCFKSVPFVFTFYVSCKCV